MTLTVAHQKQPEHILLPLPVSNLWLVQAKRETVLCIWHDLWWTVYV